MHSLTIPSIELRTTHYYRDLSYVHSQTAGEPYITELENTAMDMAMKLGEEALADGNPPVGAVLIDNKAGQTWGAKTVDKTTPRLLAHAEIRAYEAAQPTVGDDLTGCTLVTTAQPCNTCTSPYAEGKIGKIIYAAPRWAIYQVSGIMRRRSINMHELLIDGDTETVVVEGYRAEQALGTFALYGLLRSAGHVS